MIHTDDGNPSGVVVTSVAIIAGSNMVWRFARCSHAVMTTHTLPHHVGMIDHSGNPRGRHVAAVTIISGRYVAGGFACCIGAVVATHAGPGNGAVVE